MIDHIGFPVSDYARSKAFYLTLDYHLVMEVTQEQTGHDPAAGFGANGKPDFWKSREWRRQLQDEERPACNAVRKSSPHHQHG